MLNAIINFSIRNKLIIALFVLGLLGYGLYELQRLPIDAVPDITDNQVQIITTSPSLGAPDVERFLTFPIEQANSSIPGMKEIRSFSRFGLSVVTIVFQEGVDIYWARQQVAERLQQAQQNIPKSFGQPFIAPITTGLGEIYQYIVRAAPGYESKYSPMDLRTIQDWVVRRQLLGVQGVAEVASFGGHLKQFEVAIDPAKLSANGVTLYEVMAALEKNNQNTGGAYVERGPTMLYIRAEGLANGLDEIALMPIKTLDNGLPLLVRDVAQVRLGSAIRYGAMTYNGQGEVAGAVVMMLKGANSSVVIERVKERVAQIQKTLPEGIVLEPFLDRTKMVNNSISTVTKNLAEGALIVIFVLVLFLGNFRAGFLVASVIPLAMLFAIILMNTFGVSGNLMSLGALDFGLIVDGAVIIVEAVLHQLHSKDRPKLYSQQQMDDTVGKSASKMMNSAVFGQVIILIVYLPILSLQGIEGKMFKPMAETVAFALLGAFILSLTYVPMMASWLLSKKKPEKEGLADRLMAKLEKGYRRLLDRILYWPKTVLTTVVGAFALAVYLLSQMGGEFIPSLPEGDFAVETRVLTGSSLQTSIDACLKSQKLLLANFPEIEKIVGKTGSSEIPTDPMPLDASDLMIILKDRSEWTSAHTYEDLAEKMGEVLSAVPGVTYSFQYPVAMRFNELMTGARQDVVCKIFGEDMDTLAHYAQALGALCQSIDGAQEVYVEPVAGMPQIVVQYDRAAIAQYGLSIEVVNQALNTAFAGQVAGAIYEGERQFDLVLRLQQEQRRGLDDVQQLLIPTPQGQTVPLQNLAKVQIVNGINQIQRENAHRRIIVGFNVRTRDVQSTVQDLQKAVEQKLKLPPGYYIEYGGTFENLAQAKARLAIAVPVALLLIFLLLYFAFGSIKHGLLIYTAIPLSAIGGVLALYLRDMPFSISAGVGFIALFGVAVLNGIVLLAEFNRQRDLGLGDLRAVVLEGGAIRLRPVLMTAFVASLGFLPMALSNGEGAQVQRPLATVVIGGLALATFLTLFVLPILYMMFEKGISKKALTVLLLLGWGAGAQAQSGLGLQAALDTAMQNSMVLRSEQLRADYLQQLKKAAWNLEQTNLSLEMGQLNSAYFDARFSLGQSFRFPRVYKAQHRLADEQWKEVQWSQRLEQQALKTAVRKVFYEQLYWIEKQKLLAYSDSLLLQALAVVERRLALGEGDRLEQTAAQAQRQQVAVQKMQVEQEMAVLALQFNWLLQAGQPYRPEAQGLRMDSSLLAPNPSLAEHPRLKQAEQAQSVAKAQLQVAQANRLPNFSVAYNDMSMYGMGADNRLYDSRWTRFRSVQLGVGVPLLSDRAQRAQVKAEELNILRAEADREQLRRVLEGEQSQRLSRFRQQAQLLAFCESQSLPNAQLILSTAQEQLSRGQINYLEWLLLVNQAIDIRSQYLDLLHQYNLSLIALQEALGL